MNTSTPHLSDGELLRYLDGEGSPDERSRWKVHLEACSVCSGELDGLRTLMGHLSSELARVRVPEGFLERTRPREGGGSLARASRTTPRRDSWWFRAAAVFLVLLLPFAAVEPLRAWLTTWFGRSGPDRSVPAETAHESDPEADRRHGPPGALRFPVSGEELRVEIAARQRDGVLRIHRTDGTRGVLLIHGETRESLLVAEGVIRVENLAESTADYELWVPAAVRRLRVRVADRDQPGIAIDAVEGPLVVDLGRTHDPAPEGAKIRSQ